MITYPNACPTCGRQKPCKEHAGLINAYEEMPFMHLFDLVVANVTDEIGKEVLRRRVLKLHNYFVNNNSIL